MKNFLEILKKYSILITTIIILLLIGFSAYQYSRIQELKRQILIHEQNESALKDTIKYEKQKNGEMQASIDVYIGNINLLKKVNKKLADELEQQKGKIIDLNNIIIVLRQDSITLRKALDEKNKIIEKILQVDSNTYVAGWTLPFIYDSTNFEVIKGRTYIGIKNKYPLELEHIDSEIIEKLTQIDLTFGHKEENKKIRVFVQTSYPGFTAKSLHGILIDPKDYTDIAPKKHWFQGFGVGIGAAGGFNVTTGKYGLVLGPSIHYTIYRF